MATIPEEWSIPRLIDFTEKGKATGSESDTVVDTKIDKRVSFTWKFPRGEASD